MDSPFLLMWIRTLVPLLWVNGWLKIEQESVKYSFFFQTNITSRNIEEIYDKDIVVNILSYILDYFSFVRS